MRRTLTLLTALCALSLMGQSAGQSLTGGGGKSALCSYSTSTQVAPTNGTCWQGQDAGTQGCTIAQTGHCVVPAPHYEEISCGAVNNTTVGWVAGDVYPVELIETREKPGVANVTTVVATFSMKTNSGCTNDDTTICVASNKAWRIPVNVASVIPADESALVQLRMGTRTDPGSDNNFRFWCTVRMTW